MVNNPVGPPSGPPVPTDGELFLGSFSDFCAYATADIMKMASATSSTLFASLIAFLLRYGIKGSCDRASEDKAAVEFDVIGLLARSITPLVTLGHGRSNYQRQKQR